MMDVDKSQFPTMLSQLPSVNADADIGRYWIEDDLHPVTEAELLDARKFCWAADKYGVEVARLWQAAGWPDRFQWTEVIRGGVNDRLKP
jgi:hypothetical protein